MSVTPNEAQTMAEKYTEAWCSHDPEAVVSFYSEDGKVTVNDGEPSIGRMQVADTVRGFFTEFPDLVIRTDFVRTSGTYIIYLWSLEGTNSGPGGTGNRVEISGWEYWRLTGDKLIAESKGHFDVADYERQLKGDSNL